MAHPAPPPSCQETCPQEPCSSTGAVPRAWPDPPLRSKTASRVLAAVGLTNSTNYTWTGQSHRLDPRPYCGWSGLPRHCQTQASYLSKVCPPQTLTDPGLIPAQVWPPQTPTDPGLIPAQVWPPQTPRDPGLIPEPAPASSDATDPRPHTCTGPASSDTDRPGPHTCRGPASSDTDRPRASYLHRSGLTRHRQIQGLIVEPGLASSDANRSRASYLHRSGLTRHLQTQGLIVEPGLASSDTSRSSAEPTSLDTDKSESHTCVWSCLLGHQQNQ